MKCVSINIHAETLAWLTLLCCMTTEHLIVREGGKPLSHRQSVTYWGVSPGGAVQAPPWPAAPVSHCHTARGALCLWAWVQRTQHCTCSTSHHPAHRGLLLHGPAWGSEHCARLCKQVIRRAPALPGGAGHTGNQITPYPAHLNEC